MSADALARISIKYLLQVNSLDLLHNQSLLLGEPFHLETKCLFALFAVVTKT